MENFERNKQLRLNDGTHVKVIDYRNTPPPKDMFLRCSACGSQLPWDKINHTIVKWSIKIVLLVWQAN